MDAGARDFAREMVEILSGYRSATADLVGAIERFDDGETDAAIERRARAIVSYQQTIDAWNRLATDEKDVSLLVPVNGHLACIREEDADVLKLAISIKEEIGGELSRLGTLRKVDRAYLPADTEMLRIVSGKG